MVKITKLENIPKKYLKIIENFEKGDERLLALINNRALIGSSKDVNSKNSKVLRNYLEKDDCYLMLVRNINRDNILSILLHKQLADHEKIAYIEMYLKYARFKTNENLKVKMKTKDSKIYSKVWSLIVRSSQEYLLIRRGRGLKLTPINLMYQDLVSSFLSMWDNIIGLKAKNRILEILKEAENPSIWLVYQLTELALTEKQNDDFHIDFYSNPAAWILSLLEDRPATFNL